MAVCSQSPLELLQGVFCPTIAVTCSEDAEQVCMKNKLSFVEMTRPFCQLTTEGIVQNVDFDQGTVHRLDKQGLCALIFDRNLKLINDSSFREICSSF